MTYALLADGADGVALAALDDLLVSAPAPAPPASPPAVSSPSRTWDPATWGTSPEAQSDLARAMAMFGGGGAGG